MFHGIKITADATDFVSSIQPHFESDQNKDWDPNNKEWQHQSYFKNITLNVPQRLYRIKDSMRYVWDSGSYLTKHNFSSGLGAKQVSIAKLVYRMSDAE